MARYKFTSQFESYFVEVCDTSKSMSQAAVRLKMNYKTLCFHAKRLNCFKPNQAGKEVRKNVKKNVIQLLEIFNGTATYQTFKLKKRLLKENVKPHRCERCGFVEWMGQPIPLELHHVDGDSFNNSLENLELFCPNCHALTDNYRAKNIGNLSASVETLSVESLKFGEACPVKKLNGNPEPSRIENTEGVET